MRSPQIRHGWRAIRSSFLFVPTLTVADAVVLAILLITLETSLDLHLIARWPRL